jgi:hypothetical protein
MGTKRKSISRNLIPEISPAELHLLSDGLLGIAPAFDSWEAMNEPGEADWRAHKAEILAAWIGEHPGTRPTLWWTHDAPHPARKRLSGIGTPCPEVLNYAESYTLGLPDHWVSTWDVDYYNGRALDIHGDLIVCQWREGDFAGRAIDPESPPTFESQASYLKRHGLLEPGEEKRLRPAAFAPEVVLVPVEDEEPTGSIQ